MVRCICLFGAAILLALTPCRGSAADGISLVRDGGFERSAGTVSPAWTVHGSCEVVRDTRHSGDQSLHVSGEALVEQSLLSLTSGQWYACSGWLQTREVRPTSAGGHAYLAVYQYDDHGVIVAFEDFARATGTLEWTRYAYVFQVNAGATHVSVRAGIWEATGEAWVDNLTLVEGRQPTEWTPDMDAAPQMTERPERVAILRDDLPVAGAPSSPDYLAGLLRAAGVETRFLTAEELANRGILNRAQFDLVMLPYGPTFPAEAHRTFQQFLVEGGDFVSTGGYALDNLVVRTPAGWLPQMEALKAQEEQVPIEGGFEGAPWHTSVPGTCDVVSDVVRSGAHSLRVGVAAGADVLSGGCYREVAAEPGEEFVFSGWIRGGALGREADGFAYLAVYQYADNGGLVTFRDIAHVTAPQDWQRHEWRFRVASRVSKLRLIAGLYNTSGTAWFDDLELARVPPVVQINTRSGVPRDALQVAPLQIGVFDPSYPLERAAYARGCADGFAFPADLMIEGPFEGYAASGVVGWNNARWISLINAHDRYGRLRGSIGALVHNYAGHYAGSSWAFFGVTNRDIFAADERALGHGLVRLVKLMLAGVHLHNPETDRACYEQGEAVKVSVRLSNSGQRVRRANMRFDIEPATLGVGAPDGSRDRRVTVDEVARAIAPGETAVIEAEWDPGAFDHDFYRVTAALALDGQPVDRMETGFCVSAENAVAAGPDVTFADNYVEADGVRHFLLGTDTYGNMFWSAAHNPLTWARDLGMMRDNGVTVYENLQFNPASFTTPFVADERTARQVQAMTQLAQQLRLIYVPGLLIGWDTATSEEELKQQAGWCESFAKMLSGTPGVIHYTNGDLRLNIEDTSEMRALYAAVLRDRYGTVEALQEAWREEPPITGFEQVSVERPASRGWDDLRARDRKLLEQWLVRRWLSAMHEGCKAGDADRPTTVEFYGMPFAGIDLRASLGPIDIGNMGYFGLKGSDVERFPAQFRFSDMRAYGQGLSIGEFGCKTHPAWAGTGDYHETRTEQEQVDLYLAVPHYALGLGGCKVHNWCWADAEESVFPWGLVHSNDRVPKRVLSAYRNTALLFKHFEPEYREPEAWVVVPTSHRLGPNGDQVYRAVLQCINALIGAHVDFGVIDEDKLAESLPATARVLFWPLPYCPSDEAAASVERFVRRGGAAYISGDISFDPDRKRTREDRLQRLAGVHFRGETFAGLALPRGEPPLARVDGEPWFGLRSWRGWPALEVAEAGAKVIGRGTGTADEPRLMVNPVGAGSVMYTPDVLEAMSDGENTLGTVYRAVLDFAGITRLHVEPDSPRIHAFCVPTRDGGAAYVLFKTDAGGKRRIEVRTEHHGYAVTLGPQKPGFILEDKAGRTLAVEASGSMSRDGKGLARANAHFMVIAGDGRDLPDSRALLLMPAEAGRIRVGGRLASEAAETRAQVGEVNGGKWAAYETFTPGLSPAGIELEIDPDRAVSLILIAPRHDLARLGARVARTLAQP
ncbi:MAG: hypothetical protein JSV65_09430 [Armatimonadota bacterium]|nr:MAG: hypothetical protein JSV65_09430 [Armatimonadota bacterium]